MPSERKPKISILCPIRNVAPYIKEMIESTLAQTFQDWELIIMDGASTDGTVEIIMDYAQKDKRIRAYSEPDECSWHAFDKMLDLAKGEFITNVCGQDGFFDKDWLKKASEVIDRDKTISLVWSLTQGVTEDGTVIKEKDAYSHFIENEDKQKVAMGAFIKTLRIVKDILLGSWTRKKNILSKIFSKNAFLTINVFTKKEFPGGEVPQKENWFKYWLDTGMVFPDQSIIVSKKVFLDCIPRYKLGEKTVGFMTDFYYNFNTKGYLAYFIPVFGIFGRMHPGASGERMGEELHRNAQKYLDNVRLFRKDFLRSDKGFSFKDREGNSIASVDL